MKKNWKPLLKIARYCRICVLCGLLKSNLVRNIQAQLREAVVQLQEEVLQVSMPAKLRYRKIDLTAQALNKAIDAQLQPQHQAADSERERLLKQHFLDQLVCEAGSSICSQSFD